MIQNSKTASVTDLRQNATKLLQEVRVTQEPIFILQNSKKAAVLLDEKTFDKLVETAADQRDYEIAATVLREKNKKNIHGNILKK